MLQVRRLPVLFAGVAIVAVGIAVAQQVEAPADQAPNPTSDRTGGYLARVRNVAPGTPEATPAAPRSRYNTLLKQIAVPDDQKSYGDFCDFGYWSGSSYAGHNDLPAGYWVYLSPNWYIYKEEVSGAIASVPQAPRAWGPEQATGAPNTWPNSGDLTTAWASATPDGQREWLELTYKDATRPAAVLVYETYNPGAVDRVTGYDANGKEVDLWSGADPTPAGSEKGISVIPVHPDFDLTRIRIYLDSPKVPGWNEIDAVGLLDTTGTTHWAASATASSTYADQGPSGTTELEVSPRFRAAPGSGGDVDDLKLRATQYYGDHSNRNLGDHPADHP